MLNKRFTVFAAIFMAASFILNTPAYGADLTFEDPWARATLSKNVKVSAAYVTIQNTSDEADTLTGASGTIADRVEIHEMSFVDGVMKMGEVQSLDVPVKTGLSLKPGGYHIMLMGLHEPLKVGQTFNLTLHFEKAGDRTITFKAYPPKK